MICKTCEEEILRQLKDKEREIKFLERENREMIDHIVLLDRVIKALSHDIRVLECTSFADGRLFKFISCGQPQEGTADYDVVCKYFGLAPEREDNAEPNIEGEHKDIGKD